MKTRFRPLWLLGLGNAGNILYGVGSIIIQRAVWPSSVYDPQDNPPIIPGGQPGYGTAFGSRIGGVAGGTALTCAGISLSLFSAGLFLNDGHTLARLRNPEKPNYARVNTYFAAHLCAIALLVGNRFCIELFRYYLPDNLEFLAATPGAVGQAIFAITMAQSFSNCEILNSRMPLPHRGAISAAARGTIATYIVVGTITATPNMNSYLREGMRLLAQTGMTVAFSLPLTTARLAAEQQRFGTREGDRPWRALGTLGLYAGARIGSMLAAALLADAAWPVEPGALPSLQPIGPHGWPEALPNAHPQTQRAIATGALLLAFTAIGFGAFAMSYVDARPQRPKWALGMLACSMTSITLGQCYRVFVEYAHEHQDFTMQWAAMPFGLLANALAFVSLPESFAATEVLYGETPVPHRYHMTEACRAVGATCWTLWAASAGIVNLDLTVRQGLVWSASIACILGLGFPSAETRRAQRGPA